MPNKDKTRKPPRVGALYARVNFIVIANRWLINNYFYVVLLQNGI